VLRHDAAAGIGSVIAIENKIRSLCLSRANLQTSIGPGVPEATRPSLAMISRHGAEITKNLAELTCAMLQTKKLNTN
jgi:hypothetical protein